MSFEEDYSYGTKKFEKHFDKLCKQFSSILGDITHCAIIKVCKSGYTCAAGNRPDIQEMYLDNKNYKSEPLYLYSDNIPEGFKLFNGNEGFEWLWGKEKGSIGELFNIQHGFYYTEKTDDAYNHYLFASDNRQIYDILVQNLSIIKNLVMHFKQLNVDVFNEIEDKKINMAEAKNTYYTQLSYSPKTEKERLMNLLHTFALLNNNENLTDREFECMKAYCQGETAGAIGEKLHISRRTVESHLASLKEKFHVHSKKELMSKLGN